MIIAIGGNCSLEGCDKPAEFTACGRKCYLGFAWHTEPACYCAKHTSLVASELNPEHTTDCPNCGCKFGVN